MNATAPIPLDTDLLCGGCAQNLRGVAGERCPECGRRFDRAKLLSVLVPWERRAHLGRLRAFGHTVVAVTFRPSLLIDPDDNPLTLKAARGFRRRAVLALFVPGFLTMLAWYVQHKPRAAWAGRPGLASGRYGPSIADLLATPGFFYTTAVGLLLALFAVTGMASLFFAPRGLPPLQQQRGIAASLYANALLVWLVPLVGFASLGNALVDWVRLTGARGEGVAVVFRYVAFLFAAAAVLAWWLIPCRLLYGVTGSRRRVVAFALAWPSLCVVTGIAIVIGLHGIVTFVALMMLTW